ncbi:MAG: DnaJ C-terminal domain-containing protein, partial [Mycoplasma sp.]
SAEDIFSMFGNFGGFSSNQRSNKTENDPNIYVRTTVDFKTAVLGGDKPITFDRKVKCKQCHGSGAKTQSDIKKCGDCNGQGRRVIQRQTILGISRQTIICEKCEGKGTYPEVKCPECHGKGFDSKKIEINAKIKRGIKNGDTLKVPGSGHQLEKATGDLYIIVSVKQSKYFEQHDNDIYTALYVDPVSAIVGGTVKVATPYGTIDHKLPPNTMVGDKVKIAGYGIRSENEKDNKIFSKKDGNLICIIKYEIPKYSKKEIDALEKLTKQEDPEIMKYVKTAQKEF